MDAHAHLLWQAGDAAAELPGGYGVALLQTLLALAAVCILAWVVLRWAARRGLGVGAPGARVQVLERIALDARRTLWLVRVGERVLLIGGGDDGPPALLAELREDELPSAPASDDRATFARILQRTRGQVPSSKSPES